MITLERMGEVSRKLHWKGENQDSALLKGILFDICDLNTLEDGKRLEMKNVYIGFGAYTKDEKKCEFVFAF